MSEKYLHYTRGKYTNKYSIYKIFYGKQLPTYKCFIKGSLAFFLKKKKRSGYKIAPTQIKININQVVLV